LLAFIKADTTDARKYVASGPGAFVCADFAEAVHNNAESAGIRAGWVGLAFQGTKEGHALNAFETTDKGLIYIDCTTSGSPGNLAKGLNNWDTIAYIETDKTYGVLPIDRVVAEAAEYDIYALQYRFYEDCARAWLEYTAQLNAFNDEVDRFNRETSGRRYNPGSPEGQRILAWQDELKTKETALELLKAKTGNRWIETQYASYLVKSAFIHW
jgi:hypothetical protein